MATKLKTFAFLKKNNYAYPWDKWSDGSIWQVTRTVDFQCSTSSFRSAVHISALANGKKARCSVNCDVVTFQFYKPE